MTAVVAAGRAPAYPVRLTATAEPDRPSRGLWLVKWLLVIPHFVVLTFVGIAAFFVGVYAFFAVLFTGRWPRGAFDFRQFRHAELLADGLPRLQPADRLASGDDALLLVKDDKTLLAEVVDILASHGHHGKVYRADPRTDEEALQGLPTGWALIDDVQLSTPSLRT